MGRGFMFGVGIEARPLFQHDETGGVGVVDVQLVTQAARFGAAWRHHLFQRGAHGALVTRMGGDGGDDDQIAHEVFPLVKTAIVSGGGDGCRTAIAAGPDCETISGRRGRRWWAWRPTRHRTARTARKPPSAGRTSAGRTYRPASPARRRARHPRWP